MKRRDFIAASALTLTAPFVGQWADGTAAAEDSEKVLFRLGLCADVHQDLVPDACDRLRAFVDEMTRQKADMIVQLGDFCCPKAANRPFIDIWNSFPGDTCHVVGNHERDGGFSYENVLDFWSLSEKTQTPYYSFDKNGFHFISLNGNDRNPDKPARGYPSYIGSDQRQWLEADLAQTTLPTIVFCHQPMDLDVVGAGGNMDNGPEIRRIFENAGKIDGKPKVKFVFTGHYHSDFRNLINGIHYIQINSMSYAWISDPRYTRSRFDAETEKKYPHLKNCMMYVDPIWAVLTLYADGRFAMQGKKSTFLPPTPSDLGMPDKWNGVPLTASISDYKS